jgi:hypothetical protein
LGVCAVIWATWNTRNDFIFNISKKNTGYSYSYPLDMYVVLSPTREAAGDDKFWMQPFKESSSRFIQPVWLAVAQ